MRNCKALNKKLNICLKRKINDIYFSEQDANYSTYEFLDDTKYLKWIFFSNKSLVQEKISDENLSLFGEGNTAFNEVNLLSQQNSVDYFIIIENIKNSEILYIKIIYEEITTF